jgi:hypothetical protein
MTFPDSAGSGQEQIFVALDEGTTGQVLNKASVKADSGAKVKTGQAFAFITPGKFETTAQRLLVTPFQFIIQKQGQEFKRRKLTFSSLSGPTVEGQQHSTEFELAQFR